MVLLDSRVERVDSDKSGETQFVLLSSRLDQIH